MSNQAYSKQAEQDVITVMLHSGKNETSEEVFSMLKESSFYFPEHKQIWSAIGKAKAKGLDPDVFAVSQENQDIDIDYLVDLAKAYPSFSNVKTFARVIRDRSEERHATEALADVIATIGDKSKGEWQERSKTAENALHAIFDKTKIGSSGLIHIDHISKEWIKKLVDRIEGNSTDQGYTTGIPDLDAALAPKLLVPGSLVVVGARPKMGKSALLTMMVDHFVSELNLATCVFSMEMPSGQVWERMITGGIDLLPRKLYEPLNENDYFDIIEYTKKIGEQQLYIDDTPGVTISHIKSEARKIHRKHKVGLICVDYLTLMDAPKADRNDLAYGKITKELKSLARELNCIVLLMTQLNRNLESKPIMDRKPMPSDSRDTGQIEQDCDVWMGLFRAGAYEPDCRNPNLTHLFVRLNRHGSNAEVYLNMKDGYFENIDKLTAQAQDHANAEMIAPQKTRGGFSP